jgi:hypothetical protein
MGTDERAQYDKDKEIINFTFLIYMILAVESAIKDTKNTRIHSSFFSHNFLISLFLGLLEYEAI